MATTSEVLQKVVFEPLGGLPKQIKASNVG
jgi:hypothetical protein